LPLSTMFLIKNRAELAQAALANEYTNPPIIPRGATNVPTMDSPMPYTTGAKLTTQFFLTHSNERLSAVAYIQSVTWRICIAHLYQTRQLLAASIGDELSWTKLHAWGISLGSESILNREMRP